MTAPTPRTPRRTLAANAAFSGVTLFTGIPSSVRILPSSRVGILFRRSDLLNSALIPADAAHILPESRRTVLSADPSDPNAPTVQTVEHILSALAGLGVTDALIEVAAPEIPIGDGSAKPFVEAILGAGLATFAADPRPAAVVSTPIIIDDGKSRIEAHPTDAGGLELTYRLEYPPPSPIGAQQASMFLPLGGPAPDYATQIAPARTFSTAAEARAMRAMGLFKHLTPREMLVIGPDGPIDNAYRFPDEPARHKLLDLLGDLSLAARPIKARILAARTGHAHNHALARALAAL